MNASPTLQRPKTLMEKTVYDRKLLKSRNRDVINFEFFCFQSQSHSREDVFESRREEETIFEFSLACKLVPVQSRE